MMDLWERLQNILRTEEPASLPDLKRWLLDEFSVREIDRELEEMRKQRAVTMELVERDGRLLVIWWYGDHREGVSFDHGRTEHDSGSTSLVGVAPSRLLQPGSESAFERVHCSTRAGAVAAH